jgi:hypothetical protein
MGDEAAGIPHGALGGLRTSNGRTISKTHLVPVPENAVCLTFQNQCLMQT